MYLPPHIPATNATFLTTAIASPTPTPPTNDWPDNAVARNVVRTLVIFGSVLLIRAAFVIQRALRRRPSRTAASEPATVELASEVLAAAAAAAVAAAVSNDDNPHDDDDPLAAAIDAAIRHQHRPPDPPPSAPASTPDFEAVAARPAATRPAAADADGDAAGVVVAVRSPDPHTAAAMSIVEVEVAQTERV
jgi:hypothetical protein